MSQRGKKRKVGFTGKDDVKEIEAREHKRSSRAADDMDDDDDEEDGSSSTSRIQGYSLDSDEEDDEATETKASRYELQDEDQHEDLDEKFTDGGVKVTAFNLEDELEEGHFDDAGNYVEDKTLIKMKEADAWLDGMETYVPKKPTKPVALFDPEPKGEERPRLAILKEMIAMMKPSESTQQALRRSGGTASGERKWASKQKKGKRASGAETGGKSASEIETDAKTFAALTGCADELMAGGDYEIYQATYEKLAHEIKTAELAAPKVAGATEVKADEGEEDKDAIKFHYKWTNDADAELFGPYSAKKMCEWQDEEFFKSGVYCREVGKEEFYNSSRIDFELYT